MSCLALPLLSSHALRMLPDERLSPKQIEILRDMSGQRKWELAGQLYWSARGIKAAGLRAQHPEWSEEQVARETRRIFLYART